MIQLRSTPENILEAFFGKALLITRIKYITDLTPQQAYRWTLFHHKEILIRKQKFIFTQRFTEEAVLWYWRKSQNFSDTFIVENACIYIYHTLI